MRRQRDAGETRVRRRRDAQKCPKCRRRLKIKGFINGAGACKVHGLFIPEGLAETLFSVTPTYTPFFALLDGVPSRIEFLEVPSWKLGDKS